MHTVTEHSPKLVHLGLVAGHAESSCSHIRVWSMQYVVGHPMASPALQAHSVSERPCAETLSLATSWPA